MVLAAGVQGRISTLPPRFASVWWLAGAATGLNDAVMSYGWALRRVGPNGLNFGTTSKHG
jgi:hypothetical protein